MTKKFNAYEILKIAEQIERNGAKFYRKAAEIAADESAQKFLLDLAAMEDEHEKTFAKMCQEFQAKESSTSYDPDEYMLMYLNAIADDKIFKVKEDPTKILTDKTDILEILDIAIQKEKDAIVFFTTLKEIIPEDWGQNEVKMIIRQEMNHIGFIMNLMTSINSTL